MRLIIRVFYTWPAIAVNRVALALTTLDHRLQMREIRRKAAAIGYKRIEPYLPREAK